MENHPRPTSIFLVSDVRLAREALARALREYPRVEVAGCRPADEEALVEIACLRPDAVLVDWFTARESTVAARLSEGGTGVKVIAFGIVEDESEVLACAAAGVAGYVPRDASLDTLVSTVDAVVRGELVCSPRMAAVMFRRMGSLGPGPTAPAPTRPALTPRESEVADLLERGLSNKEIARALGIRVATVKNHVHHILERLQVRRRAEAVVANRQRSHPAEHAPVTADPDPRI